MSIFAPLELLATNAAKKFSTVVKTLKQGFFLASYKGWFSVKEYNKWNRVQENKGATIFRHLTALGNMLFRLRRQNGQVQELPQQLAHLRITLQLANVLVPLPLPKYPT